MLKSFSFILRYYLFWLLFFFLQRFVFLLYFSNKVQDLSFSEIGRSFLYGLRLDASMAGYISLAPLLIFLIIWIFPKLRFRDTAARAYVYFLIFLISLISVINFNIYREWGSKINAKAIDLFFESPEEAIASSSSSPILLSFLVLIFLVFTGVLLSRYIIRYKIPGTRHSVWAKLVAGIALLGLTFLSIRGGLDASPINQSMAYFSEKPILNHAAINTEWNLIHDLLNQNFSNKNPYEYFPESKADSIVAELYATQSNNASIEILNTQKPNIVLIMLESFTADVIESLGGEKGVAPEMEKLIADGLLFNAIYASGDRTDKGVIAILSAFPSQATRSIMKFNDKQEKLPAISSVLKESGYHTSFYYGGQSEFFNIKSYLLTHGFNSITDKTNFPGKGLSSWGAFDHQVFQRNLADLSKEQQPFFSALLTLSNHEPFQLPGSPRFPGESSEYKFRSTAFYTDSILSAYLKQARSEPWYKNTLFVIVADHGHRLPKNSYEIFDPGRFRIPLILYGDVLKPEFRGKVIEKTGSQTDLAVTLLSQLKIPASQFKWSKDLLNPHTPGFSFFTWDNGFGYATADQTISFDNVSRKVIYRKQTSSHQSDSTLINNGKSYMQKVFQTFLDY